MNDKQAARKIPDIAELRADVAAFLPEGTEFGDTTDLVGAGLDSLRLMKLVNRWRRQGLKMSFARCISAPTIADWMALLQESAKGPATAGRAVAAEGAAGPCAAGRREGAGRGEFPLTDIQRAYLAGRQDGQVLGGVGCHAYLEIHREKALDPGRLQAAWERVLAAHGMLRAAFGATGFQRILEHSPAAEVRVRHLEGMAQEEAQGELASLRAELSLRRLKVEEGEVAGLTLCLLPDGSSTLLVDMDMLAIDVASLSLVLHDLARAHAGEDISGGDFAAWLAGEGRYTEEEVGRAREYWMRRIPLLPGAPDLPLAKRPEQVGRTVTSRRRTRIPRDRWERLRRGAGLCGATMVTLLLAAYAEVLARWSGNGHFLLDLPLSDRRGATGIVGEFTAVEILEVDLAAQTGFAGHLQAIGRRLYEDMDHRAWSGVSVLRELARRDETAPVVFAGNIDTVLLSKEDEKELGKVTWMISQTPQVWLDFQLYADGEGGQFLVWDAVDELFPEGLLDAMFAALGGLLARLADLVPDGAAAGPAFWDVDAAALMPVAAHDHAPVPAVVAPGERATSLHGPVLAVAAADPARIALVDSGTGASTTYGELADQALRIARCLRANGVSDGDLVAVTLPRGSAQVAGVLGVLASGAAYTPVSVDQPALRRSRIHAGAGIRVALTDTEHRAGLEWPEGCLVLDIREALASGPLAAPRLPADPASLAYVIFTSGSTGEPKGVEISHAGALNTIQSVNRLYGVGPDDRALAVSALDFDLSVYDIFGLLGAGGSLVLLSEATRRNASAWARLVAEQGVTVWNSVPLLADMLVTAAAIDHRPLSGIRTFMLSGDWIPLSLPARLREAAPGCRIAAMGGATEASIWSNYFLVEPPLPERWTSVPYGRGLPGQCWRIMDAQGHDCPDWTPGELWIGGEGLALGYRADPVRTAASFVEHDGGRWYRTGDMGRFWPDGTMEFLGRRDFQVKFHGHRIELGEIATALCQHAAVRDAAVCIHTQGGRQMLVGYIVARKGATLPGEGELARFLRERVPSYMVVNHYVALGELPLTANGKLDRKRLPAPEIGEGEEEAAAAPLSPLQERVAALWAELLDGHHPSATENFFEAGGDSLLAIRLAASLRTTFGIPFGVDGVLRDPTVEGMASRIVDALQEPSENGEGGESLPAPAVHPERMHEPFPLTDVQQAYVIGRSGAYELGDVPARYYCELDGGALDLDALAKAWNLLVRRHPMMRAVVTKDGRQRILESVPEYTPVVRELSGTPEEMEAELGRLRRELPRVELPMERWPLFDLSFTRRDRDHVRVHLVFDNVMYDGRSVFLLLEEWGTLYAASPLDDARARELLPPLSLTFRDYVLDVAGLAESDMVRRDREYWLGRLDDLPAAPELALEGSPSTITDTTFRRRSLMLSAEESERLRGEAAAHGMTLSGTLLAAYAEILARWSASPRFTINLTLFNRVPFSPDVANLVGDFTALTLLAADMGQGATFAERARALQQQLWRDLAHPHMSGMQVVRELAARRGEVRMPVVFTSGLGLEAGAADRSIGDLAYAITQTPQVWLDHQVSRQNGRLVLAWDAVEALFPKGMLDAMFAAYSGLVRDLVAGTAWGKRRPERTGAEERAAAANATGGPVPAGTLLDALAAALARDPGAPAVIAPDRTLDYAELVGRARECAGRVAALEPGRVVAIVMEKGWEQAVGCVAALLAGAAWLPMEADVPVARMETVFAEAGVHVVLTQPRLKDRIAWPAGVALVGIAADDPVADAATDAGGKLLPAPGVTPPGPGDVAYIIYTSGSTGRPKGVTISHAAVLNTLSDINRRFAVTAADRTFGLSHLSFDLSVYDFWGAFLAGAACVLPEHGADRDPSRWVPLLERHHVTVWNSVPALMQMLAGWTQAAGRPFPASLRTILLSGDWIPVRLPDDLRAAGSRALLVGLGGATEASIWSNFHPVDHVDPAWKSIPYGRPLTNQRFHVLDPMGEERPAYVPGELCIAGLGLALGYWNDPQRTQASFVTHPVTGERLYRTGDLGYRREDGVLVFLGRNDFQVKLRGFRIELGELEHAAREVAGVQEAVAVMTGSGAADRRLVLVVAAPGREKDDPALAGDILASCRRLLPDYMVPSLVLREDVLPLSSNGKVDRKAIARLAEQAAPAGTGGEAVGAGTSTEAALVAIWKDLLGRDSVGVTENFFEAGGTSVLAVGLYRRILALSDGEVPMVWVFEHPTIRSLARALDGLHAAAKTDAAADGGTGGESVAARRGHMRRTGRRRG